MFESKITKQPITRRIEFWVGMLFILPLIFILGGIKAIIDHVGYARNEGY